MLPIVRTVADLRRTVREWRRAGASVGLVPTMGALHAGHLALVDAAVAGNDRAVATLFVNPSQFGPNEDLGTYPRDEARDAALFAERKADLLFAPSVDEMYPDGFSTGVTVSGISDELEGAHRPDHLAGVATVVTKLLLQAGADRAYFGEKDYQQLQVVKRLARDLDIPVEIKGVATVRDPDGLALSSRNAYLSPAERDVAVNLNLILADVAAAILAGSGLREAVSDGVARLGAAGFDSVDYLAVRDAATLAPIEQVAPDDPAARVLAAVRIGRTRLIDNRPVDPANP